jgi:hypothetical protein
MLAQPAIVRQPGFAAGGEADGEDGEIEDVAEHDVLEQEQAPGFEPVHVVEEDVADEAAVGRPGERSERGQAEGDATHRAGPGKPRPDKKEGEEDGAGSDDRGLLGVDGGNEAGGGEEDQRRPPERQHRRVDSREAERRRQHVHPHERRPVDDRPQAEHGQAPHRAAQRSGAEGGFGANRFGRDETGKDAGQQGRAKRNQPARGERIEAGGAGERRRHQVEQRGIVEDDGREPVDRPVAATLEHQPHLLPDDALPIVQLPREPDRGLAGGEQPAGVHGESGEGKDDRRDGVAARAIGPGDEDRLLETHPRHGLARISICLPIGLNGERR